MSTTSKRDIIEIDDIVEITGSGGGVFYSAHEGKQGRVTGIRGQQYDSRIHVRFNSRETDYGVVDDVTLVRKANQTVQTAPKQKEKPMKNPEVQGNVFRAQVLYTDNSSFNIGGITNFVQNSQNSKGDACFEYTKSVNDDVEGTFFVKREDVAALVLRYDNGKTEIFEYSDKVVDIVSVQMQKAPEKTVLTAEQVEARSVKKAEQTAKRKEVVDAKKQTKKDEDVAL